MMARSRRQAGFTLVELLIVVGIIGLLAAIAVPNFLSYQARSRRSEAFANLAGISRIQQTFFAERGEYFETGAWPNVDNLGTTKMEWDAASEVAFAELGWKPEGAVYYAYDVSARAQECSCTVCFTASATGDVDDDDLNSMVMFVHPQTDSDGNITGVCPSGLLGFGTPVDLQTGLPVYDAVAVQRSLDEY